MSAALHEEIDRLPRRYRDPVMAFYFEDRSCEEAAQLLHCPVGTIKGRLCRGSAVAPKSTGASRLRRRNEPCLSMVPHALRFREVMSNRHFEPRRNSRQVEQPRQLPRPIWRKESSEPCSSPRVKSW